MSTCLRKIPIARPDPRRGRSRRRAASDPLRLGDPGAGGGRVRGGVRGLRRGSPRLRGLELHHRAAPGAARPGRRAGRRGDHGQPFLHRDGQRGPLLRRHSGVRRHRPAHLQHGSRPAGSGHHPANPGHHAGSPDGAALRSAGDPARSPSGTVCRWSRTPPARSAARFGSRTTGRRIGRPHGIVACFSFHPRKVITTGRRRDAHDQRSRAGPEVPPAPPARHERSRHGPPLRANGHLRGVSRSSASTTG